MIYTYEELCKKKKAGDKLNWDDVSKEQLEELFINECIVNNVIADLYGVDGEKVRSKRRKWDISIYSPKYLYKRYVQNEYGLFDKLNNDSKERLMQKGNIDWISKALTHYIFRNGPIEDMHANNQLSQDDMKTLNKYMVNKIAGLLKLASEGEWLKIELMLDFLKNYGCSWDKPEYDTNEIEYIFKLNFGLEEELDESTKIGV